MFATKSGDVRRNELSDFVNINSNGKIAMKLEAGDGIVGVQICTEQDDVLLTTRGGNASASRSAMCACSRAANPPACAASSWPTGDEVVSLRCCIIPMPTHAPRPAPI